MAAHLNDDPTLQLDPSSERWRILRSLGLDIARCDPPCVFAVHGDWGAGKTSFLRRLYIEISGRKPPGVNESAHKQFRDDWVSDPDLQSSWTRTEPIWFEAWNYQAEPVPVVALLHEIRRQVLDHLDTLEWASNKANRLLWMGLHAAGQMVEKAAVKIGWEAPKVSTTGSAGVGTGTSFSATTGGPKAELSLGGPSIRTAREAFDDEHFGAKLTVDRLRGFLRDAIELLLQCVEAPNRRLVIFIDDLDRCDPEAAFRLLEGIRVYLNLPNCVFVLGLNQREVERAIAKFLPATVRESIEEDVILIRSQEYIEKLCGCIIRLPRLPLADQEKMLESLLAGAGPEKIVKALVGLLKKFRYLPANPRRVKAWCGVVRRLLELRDERLTQIAVERKRLLELRDERLKQIAKDSKPKRKRVSSDADFPQSAENDARALAIVASLYQFHPQLYGLLEAQPAFFEQLVTWSTKRPNRQADGTWPPDTHAILRRYRFPEGESADKGRASLFEDPMSVGVMHCAPLLLNENFGDPALREDDFRLYLAR